MVLYAISMAFEIELKAHIKDFKALKDLLLEKAEYKWAFIKEDTYWFPGFGCSDGISPRGTGDLLPSGLRVRREEHSFPNGKEEAQVFITYKIKEVKDGIEINEEREFEILGASGEFEELLRRLGLKIGIAKRKRGWAFLCDAINAELTEVEGLGWFLELEILADNNREETITQSREKLMKYLDSFGIKREAIESRYYSEMLRGLDLVK